MTQEEAKALIHAMRMSAMKAKSNLIEATGDDKIGLSILTATEPYLFPADETKINLVDMLFRYENNETVESGDMASACFVMNRSPSAMLCLCVMWQIFELPTLKESMTLGMGE